jgi:hypothetical protein
MKTTLLVLKGIWKLIICLPVAVIGILISMSDEEAAEQWMEKWL